MKGHPGGSRRSGLFPGSRFLPPVLLAVACLCLRGGLSLAAESVPPRISQVVVSSSGTHLILFARLSEAFDQESLSALREGLPLRIDYEVEIFRERRMWPDRLLASLTLAHTVKFDLVQQRCDCTARYGARETRHYAQSLDEALGWATSVVGVPVLPRGELGPGRRYYLLVRAVILPDQDPLARNIYFFKKSSRRETEWRRSPLFGIGGKQEP